MTESADEPTLMPADLNLWQLFRLYLRAGMEFGGGVAITAFLQRELVEKRKALSGSEFMAIYGLGKLIPSGTATATAVAHGYRFQGFAGSVAAVVAQVIPSLILTVLLTAAYTLLAGSPAFSLVNVTLVPAALSVVVVGVLHLARETWRPSIEPFLALGAFLGALLLGIHPSVLLLAGGLIGAFAIRDRQSGSSR